MTHAELEALENGARSATAYGAEPDETPLPRQIVNGITGLIILIVAGLLLAFLVIWKAH
jgi:hypothetical protein